MFNEINSLSNYLNCIIAAQDKQLADNEAEMTELDIELDMAYIKIDDQKVKIQDLKEQCALKKGSLKKGSKPRRNPSRTCARNGKKST
jgi:hypothetical protein